MDNFLFLWCMIMIFTSLNASFLELCNQPSVDLNDVQKAYVSYLTGLLGGC